MLCVLWVIFQTLASLAEGGSSGSGEAVGNGGMNMNGGMAGNTANPRAVNGNGQPFLAQIVPFGGALFIQPAGTPNGQTLVNLVPIGPLQQGRAFLIGQAGAANSAPLPQGQLLQPANGGSAPLFIVLPQVNGMGGPLSPMIITGQVQVIPLNGLNNQQQPATGGSAAVRRGKARVKHSVATHPGRRAQLPITQVLKGEVEESSGTEIEDDTEEKLD